MSDSQSQKDFVEFLRSNKHVVQPESGDGGFLIPQYFTVPKPGFWAKVLRFFGSKHGYKTIDMHKKIRETISTIDTTRLNK